MRVELQVVAEKQLLIVAAVQDPERRCACAFVHSIIAANGQLLYHLGAHERLTAVVGISVGLAAAACCEAICGETTGFLSVGA